MEVKHGYKQTEVGVIPEDWDDATIGNVTEIKVGRDLREGEFSTQSDATYRFPVYSNTVANLGLYGFYSSPEYEGDSLTVVGRGVGLGTAFARTGGYGAIGRLLVLFPCQRSDARFLATYINERVRIFVETGGIPQLTGIQFSKYKVALPPPAEQTAIAQALSDVDALIGALDRLIAKKRDLKQSAMQQLLTGKKRLPGFEVKHGYKQTEVGMIPEDWEVRKLGKCSKFRTGPFGSALHKSDYIDNGVPVINPMHLCDGKIVLSSAMTVTESAAKKLADFRLKSGDIVMGRRGDMGRCAVVQSNQTGWLCGTGSIIVRCADSIMPDFLQLVMSSPRAVAAIEETSVGSTMINLNQRTLAELSIQFPPLPEQTAIAKVLSDMDAELEALERRRDKTRDLKQGMMQELLTGRIRLV